MMDAQHPLHGLVYGDPSLLFLPSGTPAAVIGVRVDIDNSGVDRSAEKVARVTANMIIDGRPLAPKLALPLVEVAIWFTVFADGSFSRIKVSPSGVFNVATGTKRKSRTISVLPAGLTGIREELEVAMAANHLPLILAMHQRMTINLPYAEKKVVEGDQTPGADVRIGSLIRLQRTIGIFAMLRDRLSGRSTDESQRALQIAARLMDEQREAAEQRRQAVRLERANERKRDRLRERFDDVMALLVRVAEAGVHSAEAQALLDFVENGEPAEVTRAE